LKRLWRQSEAKEIPLTGIVTDLIESGMEIMKASTVAAKVNRLAGYYARPTPATQVMASGKYRKRLRRF
jgi:hypothetical protein